VLQFWGIAPLFTPNFTLINGDNIVIFTYSTVL
jgi:hypothetical protein